MASELVQSQAAASVLMLGVVELVVSHTVAIEGAQGCEVEVARATAVRHGSLLDRGCEMRRTLWERLRGFRGTAEPPRLRLRQEPHVAVGDVVTRVTREGVTVISKGRADDAAPRTARTGRVHHSETRPAPFRVIDVVGRTGLLSHKEPRRRTFAVCCRVQGSARARLSP